MPAEGVIGLDFPLRTVIVEQTLRIEAFAVSESGPVRRINEDACAVDLDLGLFVVADGMGGHAAGEVASRLAIDSVLNFTRRSQDSEDLSWPCGIEPALSFGGNRVRTAIYLANRRVFRAAEQREDYTGMGTTVVCALVTGTHLAIGHVGDSRLYLLSDGVLCALTRDDTWAAALGGDAETADLTSGNSHPLRHVLTNALGVKQQPDIHLAERNVVAGDHLLLCTDGVYSVVDHETLRQMTGDAAGPQRAAEMIVKTAIARGSRDNVTALVVRFGSPGG